MRQAWLAAHAHALQQLFYRAGREGGSARSWHHLIVLHWQACAVANSSQLGTLGSPGKGSFSTQRPGGSEGLAGLLRECFLEFF